MYAPVAVLFFCVEVYGSRFGAWVVDYHIVTTFGNDSGWWRMQMKKSRGGHLQHHPF